MTTRKWSLLRYVSWYNKPGANRSVWHHQAIVSAARKLKSEKLQTINFSILDADWKSDRQIQRSLSLRNLMAGIKTLRLWTQWSHLRLLVSFKSKAFYCQMFIENNREVRGAAPHLAPEQLLFPFWNSWSGEPKRSCSPKVTNVEGKKGGAAPEQRSKVEQKKLIKNCPKPKQILRHIFDIITSWLNLVW